MKVSFLTLGCKVNQAESLEWERSASKHGHQVVPLDESPDICVINTCTVTCKSDYESRRLIRRAQKAGAKILATGCYAQLNKENVSKMPGVSGVIDTTEKELIISMLNSITSTYSGGLSACSPSNNGTRTRKFLKVQDGCDYSCTYCLVWKARGKSRSINPDQIIVQIQEAIDTGFNEIVLTGVHLGLYGRDFGPGHSLTSLIHKIISQTSVPSIRVSSLEINEIDDGLLDLLKEGHICRHLHVPLQSGDNNVLAAMRRNYSQELFRDRILQIKDHVGDIALGTDIIAGFPTETIESFQNTIKIARELPFTYFHVFPFSPRPGTKASKLQDIVGDEERKKRALILRNLSSKKKDSYASQQVGKKLSVLIEKCEDNKTFLGTSDNYLKVHVSSSSETKGRIVTVEIEKSVGNRLLGKLLEIT